MPKFRELAIPGVLLIEPDVFHDERGYFFETYHRAKYAEAGIDCEFVQDNHSHSTRGVLRGLHSQVDHAQAKLVRAAAGEVFDVAVDIRRGSPHFGRWVGATLSEENRAQLYMPAGFAHGFCVLSEIADLQYKCSRLYDAADEITVAWNDPAIGIDWPLREPVLSDKDQVAPPLSEVRRLPRFGASS
jgi:dTDP-4-dehydrorhamnose 3,5-epimerase